MSAATTDRLKKKNKRFYCPIGPIWRIGTNTRTWYQLSFEIGKDGCTESYDNVSGLAKSILNAPDSIDNIEALKNLKQYKDKHVTLYFWFHPWRPQDNDVLLNFVNVNKAFGEYISKFKMGLTNVTNNVENQTWQQLFKAIKYNCLYHKLDTIELEVDHDKKHCQSIYHGIMNLINCESKLTKLSISEIPYTFLLYYTQIYFVYLINIIDCHDFIIQSLQRQLIPNDIIKLIFEHRGKRDKFEMILTSRWFPDKKVQFDQQKILKGGESVLMRQISLLINKYEGIFNIDIKGIDYAEDATYTMSQFDKYMALFFENGTKFNVNGATLFCE